MKKVIPSQSVLIPETAELVFKGIIFDVYQWQQELFDGTFATFEMLRRADTAVTLAVVEDKLLVIDDDQPNRSPSKSFPGGRIDDTDPDIVSAAKRETLEETGYNFNNWRLVKVSQPSTKIEWFVYVWIAWEATGKTEPKLDPGERITVNAIGFDEVKAMVMNDQGHLGEARDIFKDLNSVEDLINLPEFKGKELNS